MAYLVISLNLLRKRSETMNSTAPDAGSNKLPNPAQAKEASQVSFVSNLATVMGGQVSCALVALLVQVCYARFLGPAGRGELGICLMTIALGTIVGGLGCELPLVVWTAGSKGHPAEWVPAVVWAGFLGSAVASSVGALIYWTWHPAFLKGMTPTLAAAVLAGIPLNIAVSYLMAILTGLERFRLRAVLALANQLFGLAGILILILIYGRTPAVALIGSELGMLASAVITAALLRDFLRGALNLRVATREFWSATSLGVRGQLGNIATFFNYRLDVFVVNYFLDTAQVGIYAVGVVVAEGLWQIPQAAALALFPRTARTLNTGAAEFTCRVVRQVLLVACITAAGLALVSPFAIPRLFGAQFSASVAVIWWILPGVIALSLAKLFAADLGARGKPEFSSIAAFIALVVTVALDFILIPRMGINGAALASSASYILNAMLLGMALKREIKVTWRYLLVPSFTEFLAYRLAWLRCKAWLWPAASTGLGRVE